MRVRGCVRVPLREPAWGRKYLLGGFAIFYMYRCGEYHGTTTEELSGSTLTKQGPLSAEVASSAAPRGSLGGRRGYGAVMVTDSQEYEASGPSPVCEASASSVPRQPSPPGLGPQRAALDWQ